MPDLARPPRPPARLRGDPAGPRQARNPTPVAAAGAAGYTRTAPPRGAVAWPVRPGYHAGHYPGRAVHPARAPVSSTRPDGQSMPRLRLPRLVARGCPVAMPGRFVRDTFLRRIGPDA